MVLGALTLAGCAPGPSLVGDSSYAANTSRAFTENRVFYLDRARNVPPAGVNGADASCQCVSVRALLPSYERPAPDADGASDARSADEIPSGSPLSVIVSQVRLPESLSGPVDVAVVLDIVMGDQPAERATSLVVFYQRDVRGGMTLNFGNLLVYTTEQWDASSPPFFRLRVLDVRTERNQATGVLLDQVSNLASSLGDLVPSPALPAISLAIRTASLVLANQDNRVIIDYSVQFFGSDLVNAVGGRSDLASLQRGAWIVVGRPRDQSSRFWRSPLVLDRRTGELFDERDVPATPRPITREPAEPVRFGVQAPYILMTTVPYSARVYGLVQERSAALLRLLTSRDSSAVNAETLGQDVAASVRTFVLLRDLRRQRSIPALTRLVDALQEVTTPPSIDADAIWRELELVLPGEAASSLKTRNRQALYEWYNNAVGALTFDAEKYRAVKQGPVGP